MAVPLRRNCGRFTESCAFPSNILFWLGKMQPHQHACPRSRPTLHVIARWAKQVRAP